MVNMGYDGENATLTLRKVEANQIVSKINEVRVFIPDGKCIREGVETSCYEAPVTFTVDSIDDETQGQVTSAPHAKQHVYLHLPASCSNGCVLVKWREKK